MKKLLFPFFILFQLSLFAQDVLFAGEGSPNSVRLVWYPYEWPSKTEGVIIKRRASEKDDWEMVTEKPIVQEIKDGASLYYIKDEEERLDIENYRKRKFLRGKWENISADEYKAKLGQENELRTMRLGLRSDFRIAAASGFAMIDLPPKGKKAWEYGIFFSEKQKNPTKTVLVKMEEPTYNLKVKPDIKIGRKSGKYHITGYWYVDSVQFVKNFKTLDFRCFKLEEEAKKRKLIFGQTQPGSLVGGYGTKFTDRDASDSLTTTYKLFVGTIFGTMYEICTKEFDPTGVPPVDLYLKTLPISDANYDLSKGLPPITWDFHTEDEKYIVGFRVMEQQGVIEGTPVPNWVQVSKIIDKSERSFVDPRKPINKKRYKFRVEAVFAPGLGTKSSFPQEYFYKYIPKAPAPKVDYEWVERGGGHYLRIFWSEENKTENTVGYMLLYSYSGEEDSYSCPTDGRLLEEPEYFYNVQDPYGRYYYFKVAQLNSDEMPGAFSPGLKALTHTTEMPHFQLVGQKVEDNTITVSWRKPFPKIEDMAGYDVFVNGKLIKTEVPEALETSYKYKKPGKYDFKIVAKTKFGLTTEDSWLVKVEE